jgi:MFS family permease
MTAETPAPPRAALHRNADYLRLVAAQALSITGREIETLVLPLLVLALTGSPVQVGLVAAAQSLPYLLLSLPAGALVDRWNRKRVMIVADAVRALAFASLPLAWWAGALTLAQLYAVAAVAGSAFVFYNIAEISSLAQVAEPLDLPRAVSINTVVEWIGENAGPALGGLMVGLWRGTVAGAMLAYAVQAAMLGAGVGLLGGVRRPLGGGRAEAAPRRRLLAEIGEGARWLARHAYVRAMAALAMALNLIFGPMTLAMIVEARDGFHGPPAAIGLMFTAGGVAGLAATLAAPWLRRHLAIGAIVVGGVVVWALGLTALAAAGSMLTLAAAWLIMPAASGAQEVTTMSYRLSLIPAEMQGRVNSVFRFLAWGVRPASLALGGALIAWIGARQTLWCLAAAMAATALAAALSPLRRAR